MYLPNDDSKIINYLRGKKVWFSTGGADIIITALLVDKMCVRGENETCLLISFATGSVKQYMIPSNRNFSSLRCYDGHTIYTHQTDRDAAPYIFGGGGGSGWTIGHTPGSLSSLQEEKYETKLNKKLLIIRKLRRT